MFNETELTFIHHCANGMDDVTTLSKEMDRTRTQINNIVRSLKKKGILSDSDGIRISSDPFAIRLLNIMRPSKEISKLFSDSGLDVLIELREPKTIKELKGSLGISQATIYRRLRIAMDVGAVMEEDGFFQINAAVWPDLPDLLTCALERRKVFDERIPYDSEIILRKGNEVVFSNQKRLEFNTTGFTRMGDIDPSFGFCDRYYTTSMEMVDPDGAFEDAFLISKVKEDYRLRLMLVLFYRKHEGIVNPPSEFLETYDGIVSNRKVTGWPTLKDIESRM